MSVLPKGWVEMTLGEACRVEYGKGLSANQRIESGTVPVVGSAGVIGRHSASLVPGPVIVIGRKGNAGAIHLLPDACWPIDTTYFVRVPTPFEPAFLAYQLRAAQLRSLDSSTAVPSLRRPDLEACPILVAPIREQQRIVAAIEEQVSRLDTAEQLLRSARSRLDPLVVSFIDVATDGFPTKPLGELVREPLRNGHSAKRSITGSIPVFTLTAVTARNFSQANTKLTDANPQRVEDLWAEPGDIFIERSNTPELVGTAALYAGPARRAIFPDLLIRVRCGPQLLPEYAELGLRSTRIRRYFQRVAKGIAGSMPKIDQDAVLAAELPLPPVADQARLVKEVAQNVSIAESLATAVDHALLRSGQLRRAILERAFTGQLTPQDPSDEPAAILMERIAARRGIESPRRRQPTRKALSR